MEMSFWSVRDLNRFAEKSVVMVEADRVLGWAWRRGNF